MCRLLPGPWWGWASACGAERCAALRCYACGVDWDDEAAVLTAALATKLHRRARTAAATTSAIEMVGPERGEASVECECE